MQITREFVLAEIADLEAEMQKAQTFVIQAQAAIDTHRVILRKLDELAPIVELKEA